MKKTYVKAVKLFSFSKNDFRTVIVKADNSNEANEKIKKFFGEKTMLIATEKIIKSK